MNRAELITALAERSGLQKQKASKVLEALHGDRNRSIIRE